MVIGIPNVGKSTFFNRVCGRRISIVDDLAGVTRDRIYADAEWCGCSFTLVDTGGLDFEDRGEIQKNILNQAQVAIDLADVILLFVDGKAGLTHSDTEVAEFLRKSNKRIIRLEENSKVIFAPDKAVFFKTDGNLKMETKITVNPNYPIEIRKVKIENIGNTEEIADFY